MDCKIQIGVIKYIKERSYLLSTSTFTSCPCREEKIVISEESTFKWHASCVFSPVKVCTPTKVHGFCGLYKILSQLLVTLLFHTAETHFQCQMNLLHPKLVSVQFLLCSFMKRRKYFIEKIVVFC